MDSLLTVTGPASNRKLTTAAALRTELGLSSGSLDDTRANDVIARASKAAERYCSRIFAQETVSEVFRLAARDRGPEKLILARWPIVSITSVTEDGNALTGSDYEADLATGQVFRLSSDTRTAWCAQKTTVVYVGGYVLPGDGGTRTLPEDVEAAALKLAAGFYFGAARDPLVKGESADGIGSVDYWVGGMPGASGELPPDVLALLAPYRVMIV